MVSVPTQEEIRAAFDSNVEVFRAKLAEISKEVAEMKQSTVTWSAQGRDAALRELQAVVDPQVKHLQEMLGALVVRMQALYEQCVDEEHRARIEALIAQARESIAAAMAQIHALAATITSGELRERSQQYIADATTTISTAASTFQEKAMSYTLPTSKDLHSSLEDNLNHVRTRLATLSKDASAAHQEAMQWSAKGSGAALADLHAVIGPKVQKIGATLAEANAWVAAMYENHVDADARAKIEAVAADLKKHAETVSVQLQDTASALKGSTTVKSSEARETAQAYFTEAATKATALTAFVRDSVKTNSAELQIKFDEKLVSLKEHIADLKKDMEKMKASAGEWKQSRGAALSDLKTAVDPQVKLVTEKLTMLNEKVASIYEEHVDPESRSRLNKSISEFASAAEDAMASIRGSSTELGQHYIRETTTLITAAVSKVADLKFSVPHGTFEDNFNLVTAKIAQLKQEVANVKTSVQEWSAKGPDAALNDLKEVVDPQMQRIGGLILSISEWIKQLYTSKVDDGAKQRLEKLAEQFKETAEIAQNALVSSAGDVSGVAAAYVVTATEKVTAVAKPYLEPTYNFFAPHVERVQDVVSKECPAAAQNVTEMKNVAISADPFLQRAYLIAVLFLQTLVILCTTGASAAKKQWFEKEEEVAQTPQDSASPVSS